MTLYMACLDTARNTQVASRGNPDLEPLNYLPTTKQLILGPEKEHRRTATTLPEKWSWSVKISPGLAPDLRGK